MGPNRRRVVLHREEASGNLPMVCMQCGEPATVWKVKGFHTHQFRPGGRILQLILWLSSPKMPVQAPFCSRHQNHWEAQSAAIWILAGVVALVIAGVGVGVGVIVRLQLDPESGRLVVVLPASIICISAGLIVRFVREQRGVIMAEITPEYIVFRGVHDRFLDALEAQRHGRTRIAAANFGDPTAILPSLHQGEPMMDDPAADSADPAVILPADQPRWLPPPEPCGPVWRVTGTLGDSGEAVIREVAADSPEEATAVAVLDGMEVRSVERVEELGKGTSESLVAEQAAAADRGRDLRVRE
jgi:hypothetical protein